MGIVKFSVKLRLYIRELLCYNGLRFEIQCVCRYGFGSCSE